MGSADRAAGPDARTDGRVRRNGTREVPLHSLQEKRPDWAAFSSMRGILVHRYLTNHHWLRLTMPCIHDRLGCS